MSKLKSDFHDVERFLLVMKLIKSLLITFDICFFVKLGWTEIERLILAFDPIFLHLKA